MIKLCRKYDKILEIFDQKLTIIIISNLYKLIILDIL